MVLYVFLCLLHYFSGRPFWLDENFIFSNVRELKPHELFGQLRYGQGFPRFYLFFIQQIGSVSNFNMYALRLLPLICMLASFFVWFRIIMQFEKRSLVRLLFIFCWPAAHYMTYFAAELKQYSGDLLVASLFTYFILNMSALKETRSIKNILLCFALPFLALFSYTAYFFLWIPLVNFCYRIFVKKESHYPLLVSYCLGLFVVVPCTYFFDIRYTIADQGLKRYWDSYYIDAHSIRSFFGSFTEGTRNLFTRWYLKEKIARRIATFFLPTTLWFLFYKGVGSLFKTKGVMCSLAGLAIVLYAELICMGLLRLYPFTGCRVTIFFCPFAFYVTICGIFMIKRISKKAFLLLSSGYGIFLLMTCSLLIKRYILLYSK